MKITTLSKMILIEHARYIATTIFLFITIDYIFINFTGVDINAQKGVLHWLGNNESVSIGLSTILLKLLNISVIFITIGKIIDKITSDSMVYILARASGYSSIMNKLTFIIISFAIFLLCLSHLVYYCIVGFPSDQCMTIASYLLFECMGFIGVLLLYIILNNAMLIENTFLFIIITYVINTLLPFPILISAATINFIKLEKQLGIFPLLLCVLIIDVLILAYYRILISGRSINIC